MRYKYWACAPEPGGHRYWGCVVQLPKPESLKARAPQQEKLPQGEAHAPQLEVGPTSTTTEKPVRQWRPNRAKNK